MKPAFRIEVDGRQDATRAIAERLLSLSVSDSVGTASDTVRIEIDDDGRLELPRRGAVLGVLLGWEGGLRDMGNYAVDGLRLRSGPGRMQIRATAADLRGPLKSLRTHSWTDATLGDVVADTASHAGLGARVEPSLARIRVPHLDQAGESGLQLLTRLGRDHGYAWRVWGGRVVAIPLSGGSTASGGPAGAVPIRPPVREWGLRVTDRPRYASVVARWRHTEEAEAVEETAGSGEPVYELRWELASQAEAAEAAASRLAALRREAEGLDVTPGLADPRIRALVRLDVRGLRTGVDGDWICSRAEHVIDRSGYRTRLEAYRAQAA